MTTIIYSLSYCSLAYPYGRAVLPNPPGRETTLTVPASERAASNEIKNLFHYSKSNSNKRKHGAKATGISKKKKLKMWNHTFVCLSNPADDSPPDSMARAQLQLAGLGEKKISFFFIWMLR